MVLSLPELRELEVRRVPDGLSVFSWTKGLLEELQHYVIIVYSA